MDTKIQFECRQKMKKEKKQFVNELIWWNSLTLELSPLYLLGQTVLVYVTTSND